MSLKALQHKCSFFSPLFDFYIVVKVEAKERLHNASLRILVYIKSYTASGRSLNSPTAYKI